MEGESFCNNCGASIPASATHCPSCGAEVMSNAAAAPAAPAVDTGGAPEVYDPTPSEPAQPYTAEGTPGTEAQPPYPMPSTPPYGGMPPMPPGERPTTAMLPFIFVLLAGILFIVNVGILVGMDLFSEEYSGGAGFVLCGAPLIVLGVLNLAVAGGLYGYKGWSRKLGLVVAILSLILALIAVVFWIASAISISNDPLTEVRWGRLISAMIPPMLVVVFEVIAIVFIRKYRDLFA